MSFKVEDSDILQELEELGASVSDDTVVFKMKELCLMYRKDASDLVSTWFAYATTNSLEPDPTLDNLVQMEREMLSKQTSKASRKSVTRTAVNLIPPVFTADTIDMVDDMMDCYETPKRKNYLGSIKNSQSPVLDKSSAIKFSPSSYSPASAKYSGRTSKGDIICSFGTTNTIEWITKPGTTVQVTAHEEKCGLEKPYQYMFEKLRERCGVLNDIIEDMAEIMKEKYEFEDCGHVRMPQLEEVNVVGRICCDGNGKLNSTSVLLEGSMESSSGHAVPVDLSKLPQYALFPGQVIAGKAVNVEGSKLIMKSLLEGVTPKFSTEPPKFGPEPLDIVIAAGPFTTSDSLSYEPLADLMTCVRKHNPHVLILIGPFVDCKHEMIQKGSLNETYEQLFQNQITSVLESLIGCSTTLVLVPSIRDIHHHVIYPTPPMAVKSNVKVIPVFCASDPCLLNINGLIIGVTSLDILFHLGKEEISHPPGLSDRLGRLASHLLSQHSFYPLYPACENVNISYEHMEMYGRMTVCPHILITPSDLRCFVKDIHGCCCVNPERLAKGLGGGSFARIRVEPCSQEQYNGSLTENIRVDIVRI